MGSFIGIFLKDNARKPNIPEDKKEEFLDRAVKQRGEEMSSFERPKFLEGEELDDFYYSTSDPYTMPPPMHLNLGGLMKYAKEKGKKIVDLSKEEVDQFRI